LTLFLHYGKISRKYKEELKVPIFCDLCPLGKYQKIVLGTDVSEANAAAVNVTLELAKLCQSFVFVVSAIEIDLAGMGLVLESFLLKRDEIIEKLKKERTAKLEILENKLQQMNIQYKLLLPIEAQPHQAIISVAEEEKADAIIVGTQGKTGLKKVLLGSVAARTIGYTPCPIMVVPTNAKVGFKNLLIATDGSENSNLALEEALRAAEACQAQLTIVCVVKSNRPPEYKERAHRIVEEAKQKATAKNIETEVAVLEGEPWLQIVELAKQKDIDVIIMGRYGRTGLKKILIGSVTERVASCAPCAVLVIPS